MSKVFLDIETLPNMDEGEVERIAETMEFKAPSNLSKGLAAADLGLSDDDVKYKAKDDVIAMWVERFKDEKRIEMAQDIWRKQALNPDEGRILSIVAKIDDSTVFGAIAEDESELLDSFWHWCEGEIVHSDLYAIGHNIKFDLGFLWKRSIINGVTIPFKLKPHGRHGQDFFCTMTHWAGYGQFIGQDRLARILGLPEKPDDINGSNVLDHYLAGDLDRILEYNRHDVETVYEIYQRIAV